MTGALREKVLVMGVAGCGKSTVGVRSAQKLRAQLIEGDAPAVQIRAILDWLGCRVTERQGST
jgi:predicted kinase